MRSSRLTLPRRGSSVVERALHRLSLAHKLSLLTGSVIALCLVVVLGATYEVLTRSAVSGMRARLDTSTHHLAGIVQAGMRQVGPRYAMLANDSAVRRALNVAIGDSSHAARHAVAAAHDLLARFSLPTDSALRIELWDARGHRVAFVRQATSGDGTAGSAPDSGSMPRVLQDAVFAAGNKDSLQLSRLFVHDGRVYFWFVHPVIRRGVPIGYVAQQRRLGANAQTDQSLRALAGEGVTAYYANDDGTVWTTLGGRPAPSRSIPSGRMQNDGDTGRALIESAAISGTPLFIVMESGLDFVLAPIRATIAQLLVVGLTMMIVAMGAALFIGRRMVGPIVAIADAAQAIARGQYDVRVSVAREVELARLGESFNHMANEVAAAEETRREIAHMGRVAAVAELASSITHELRQPLTAILANGDSALLLLRRQKPDLDDVRECVHNIIADCDRAAGVIAHIRVFLRKEAWIAKTVDLNEVCRDAVHLLRQDAARRRTQVELSLSPNALTVVGDPVQLQQVVINLTLNALDAASVTSHRSRVSICTRACDGFAEIAVMDNGPGFTLDLERRLFEPFFTTKDQGLGMGLAIVRSIVERHHGRIQATNASGSGALFRVMLPVVAAPVPAGDVAVTAADRWRQASPLSETQTWR